MYIQSNLVIFKAEIHRTTDKLNFEGSIFVLAHEK